MAHAPAEALRSEQDPKALLSAAVGLARSRDPKDQAALRDALLNRDFLERLDSREEYEDTGRKLRIALILDQLKRTGSPASDTIVALSQDAGFLAQPERIDALIEASSAVHPPPPPLVEFWSRHCRPGSSYQLGVVDALVENRSEPALELLERKMADPSFSDQDKLAWMRTSILLRRDHLSVLRSCGRMLNGPMHAPLKVRLVEVLFDYRLEWYTPHGVCQPPDRVHIARSAADELRRIGEQVLRTMTLDPNTRAAVERTLKTLHGRR